MDERLTDAQRKVLEMVAAADGYEAGPTDSRMLNLWERDLLDFDATDCVWLLSDAGRAVLEKAA